MPCMMSQCGNLRRIKEASEKRLKEQILCLKEIKVIPYSFNRKDVWNRGLRIEFTKGYWDCLPTK